jgi:hypothetical protein
MNTCLNNKKEYGLKLASRAVWAMFVWAWEDGHSLGVEGFGIDEEPGVMMRQAKIGSKGRISSPALLNHPVGVACVGACIGDGSDQQSVEVGIQVMGDMLQHHIPKNIDLFFRLLSVKSIEEVAAAEDPAYVWDYRKLMCTTILNGGVLCNSETEAKSLTTVVRAILANHCIQPQDVRSLDAQEIRWHWDVLVDCWECVLREGIQAHSSSMGVSTITSPSCCLLIHI